MISTPERNSLQPQDENAIIQSECSRGQPTLGGQGRVRIWLILTWGTFVRTDPLPRHSGAALNWEIGDFAEEFCC